MRLSVNIDLTLALAALGTYSAIRYLHGQARPGRIGQFHVRDIDKLLDAAPGLDSVARIQLKETWVAKGLMEDKYYDPRRSSR